MHSKLLLSKCAGPTSKNLTLGVSVVAQPVKNPTDIHEDMGLIPGFTQ